MRMRKGAASRKPLYGTGHAENEDAEAEIFIQLRHRQPVETRG